MGKAKNQRKHQIQLGVLGDVADSRWVLRKDLAYHIKAKSLNHQIEPLFLPKVRQPKIASTYISILTSTEPRSKRIRESSYPIFWVEAFDVANQKWIPVDPLITNNVSKPSKFEPPASDSQNNLTYVLAFEEDGSARDVTRRYTKAFNAKTRKGRVEVTNGGEKWWKRVLKIWKRPYLLARDQIEDSLLASREAAEPMPKNVLDFKDHPYYALERHLKRTEVINPKREAGKVAVGRSGGQQILEPIFRRRDVHVVKSANSWYRMGREIKVKLLPHLLESSKY